MIINNPEILLKNTDCETLEEIRVISLRNQQITQCLKILSRCENLTILYLQSNMINVKDLNNLVNFPSLKKIDLSDNQLETLPTAKIFAGLTKLQFIYLHNNNITKWQDL
jgi:Leucine-rich repeat (LRR) protein